METTQPDSGSGRVLAALFVAVLVGALGAWAADVLLLDEADREAEGRHRELLRAIERLQPQPPRLKEVGLAALLMSVRAVEQRSRRRTGYGSR